MDHLFHLREVLSNLRKAGLTANSRKCHVGLTKAMYLGYCIGWGLLRPKENKVEAIRDYQRPTTKKQVCAFLGYYSLVRPQELAIRSAAKLFTLRQKNTVESQALPATQGLRRET
ncbi:hypothetical protein QTP70_001285 [Hemibagrus guttatus]|uniref:Reverse transcriptase n=1 Tax=Hemibagrus guttatus TaxID=175788 RepID=A0AAE0Q4P7_9TELE|nr:hypothetical protein QTP70_001285 [Hemibagrus guttatus]